MATASLKSCKIIEATTYFTIGKTDTHGQKYDWLLFENADDARRYLRKGDTVRRRQFVPAKRDDRYLVVSSGCCDAGLTALDIPPKFDAEIEYFDDLAWVKRKDGLEEVASLNQWRLDGKSENPRIWYALAEVGQKQCVLCSIHAGPGVMGELSSDYRMPLRLVVPTANEVKRFAASS